jgi:TonB family protein
MPVPTYERFIEPVMRYLAEHPEGAPARDVQDAAAEALHLSDADRAELLPSGVQRVYKNRAGRAHDRLKRAGLSLSLRRGHWQLTEQGRVFASAHPAPLSAEVLEELVTEHKNVLLRPTTDVEESVTIPAELAVSKSEPEPLGAIFPDQPTLTRILEEQVEAGFPAELALDLVLQVLVMRAVDATGASSAALALARGGGEMICRAATGLHAPDLGVPLNTRDDLSGACLSTRQPQFCVDTESDPRVDSAMARRLGIRSMLIVPVLDQDDVIGVLEIFSSQPSAFSDRERTLLEALARDCVRVRLAAADLVQHPPAAFTPVPSDQPQSHQETSLPTSPTFVEALPSPSKTQPLYQRWSLILGTLAILATVAFSFMVGSRLGWLVSSSPQAKVPVPRASKSDAARPRAKPAAHTRKSTSLSRAARSTSSAQPVPTHSADDLVVYDHGKVIFRAKPSTKKSGASPVVDASKSTRIAPLPGVWLAPDQAERRLRNRIEPQYPADAMAAHRSGDVVLEVLVAEDGSVVSIRTLSGDPLLAAAAADAVRQWRYGPYRQHERPSQFQTDVTLKFSLPNEN